MRIALGQLHILWKDRTASILHAEQMIADASEAACDVILFPELSFTGFTKQIDQISEPKEQSQTVSRMKELAQKYQIAIGFGWSASGKSAGDKSVNYFTLVDADGNIAGEYSKLHPFTYGGESECFEKGNEIVTVPFLGHTVGLFICYDLRFPEIFQLSSRKADVLFVIANWPAIRSAHWETLLRARAIETQSYVVGVNCVGEIDQIQYSGDSMAIDSIGNILGKISGKEGILVCDIDDRAWSLRNKFATAADRREDFYIEHFQKEDR